MHKRLAVLLLPADVAPGRPQHDIAALVQHVGDPVRLQMHTIGDADFAPITAIRSSCSPHAHRSARTGRSVRPADQRRCGAAKSRSLVSLPTGFRHRTGVDDADQTAAARLGVLMASRWPTSNASQSPHRRSRYSRPTFEMSAKPIAAAPAGGTQAPLAQAVGQHQASQQGHRVRDLATPGEGLGGAGAGSPGPRPHPGAR